MKYLFFIIKLLLILGVVIWASYYPGDVILDWDQYIYKMSLRVFLGGSLFIILIILTLYGAYKNLFNSLKVHMERRSRTQLKSLQEQMIQGLIDLELKNTSAAKKILNQLLKKKSKDALVLFYEFKVAYDSQDKKLIESLLPSLQLSPQLKILSIKYQIEQAVSQNNYPLAFTICRDALRTLSGAWLHKVGIFLAIKEKNFEQAHTLLKEGTYLQEFDNAYVHYMGSIIWYQHAKTVGEKSKDYIPFLSKSHDLNIRFTNAAVRLACAYKNQDQISKAKETLLETWNEAPESFEIAEEYVSLGKNAVESAKLARELLEMQPQSKVGRIVLVLQYIKAKLWGEVKHEMDDLALLPSKDLGHEKEYLEALLVHEEKGDNDKAFDILQRLLESALRQKWQCQYCGNRSNSWQPFCESCDAFDHLDYVQPKNSSASIPILPG